MVYMRPLLTYSKGHVYCTKLSVLEPSTLFSILCNYVTMTVIGVILLLCHVTAVTVT